MKTNSIIETRRAKVSSEARRRVDLSFSIVDRIHAILTEKGLKQKDLATLLGKNESEISKWMRGSKLHKGDKLMIAGFYVGFELLISDVERGGQHLGSYQAAKQSGLTSVEII